MEKFLTAETSNASSVSNEPSGKVLGFGWVQKQNLKSRNVRSLTCFSLAVRKQQFVSLPLTPGGLGVLPLLTCVCLQWHVFISFSFFGQIHSCYFHIWCEVCILEVMWKHPGSENLWNGSFAAVKLSHQANRDSSGRLSCLFVWQSSSTHNQKKHANESDWNPVQNVKQCQRLHKTGIRNQETPTPPLKNMFLQDIQGCFHDCFNLKCLILQSLKWKSKVTIFRGLALKNMSQSVILYF